MTLVVEDGTGLANAESYQSAAQFTAYWAARNVDVTSYTTPQIEASLRKGASYVDHNWMYRAVVLQNTQAMEFPRVGLTDRSGRTFTGVPARVAAAQNEAAYLDLTGQSLFVAADRGGQVKTEGIGTITTTYADNAPASALFEAVSTLLAPFVRSADRPYIVGPVYTDNDPTFYVGQMDAPQVAAPTYSASVDPD